MRLWTLHPEYLDTKGLLACWREGLLAQAVLQNRTKGYRSHSQLLRFKQQDPDLQLLYIGSYLSNIADEAHRRNYTFSCNKIEMKGPLPSLIPVTSGQIQFERSHLLEKLKTRDQDAYHKLRRSSDPRVNSIFQVVRGGVEAWEKIKKTT